jgi:hypothetical protein
MKIKKNHILNYNLLFTLIAVFIGNFYVDYKNNYYENELINIVNKIEDHYKISDEKYDSYDLNLLIENNKDIYLEYVEEEYFVIRINKGYGGIIWMVYDSREKEVKRKGQY